MKTEAAKLTVAAVTETERLAAALLCDALETRCGARPSVLPDGCIRLRGDASRADRDSFSLRETANGMEIIGFGIRALIYGFSFFLRKSVFRDGCMTTVCRRLYTR